MTEMRTSRNNINKFKISIKWITENVRKVFPIKDKYICSCIYKGDYIWQTECNALMRWGKQNNPMSYSELMFYSEPMQISKTT